MEIFKRFRKPNYPRRRLKMSNAYNEIELMICTASRIFEDGASVSVGTGIPCAAVMLAQKLYAPNILITFEAGAVAPYCRQCLYQLVIPLPCIKLFKQALHAIKWK